MAAVILDPSSVAAATSADRLPGFHFLIESLGSKAARQPSELPVLELPPGVSHLLPARESLALSARKPRRPALTMEPVVLGGRPRLLLLTPPSLDARLNGQALPLLALLTLGDQLQLGPRHLLHLTEYRTGGIVRPDSQLQGQLCGVCRLPLTADTQVYLCGGCGLPLHLEGAPKPEAERLECALFGDCPSCGSEVQTASGYLFQPEL